MASRLKVTLLAKDHDVASFDCGIHALNTWFKTIASQHQKIGTSRVYVLIDEENPVTILGFFAMAVRGLTPTGELPEAMQKKLPMAVSGYTLARLAVSTEERGKGFGERLLLEAMEKAYRAAQNVGGFALFVDAKDGAASFYEKYGFQAFPDDPHTLVLPIASMPEFLGEHPET
mgnify:CR=1 FL=1